MGLLKKIAELATEERNAELAAFPERPLKDKAVEVWRRARVRRAYGHADKWQLES